MPPRLLALVRAAARLRRFSRRTETTYVRWVRRYVHFCAKRHPSSCGVAEVESFLAHLAAEHRSSPPTQRQALSALRFLYGRVLHQPLVAPSTRPKRIARRPKVLEPLEVERVLTALPQRFRLPLMLVYGAGLRLSEVVALRVRDVDVRRQVISVPRRAPNAAREVVLPTLLGEALARHVEAIRVRSATESMRDDSYVPLPDGGAARNWRWRWLFSSDRTHVDARTKLRLRQHVNETTVRRVLALAGSQAGIRWRVTPYVFRHSFAVQLLRTGHSVRSVQHLLGHRDATTTAVYLGVVAGRGVPRSPIDHLRLPPFMNA